ncbi:hypothetical protein NL676_013614 [Syzygium grande]|nr:hypothetical protein NL676_013614 [Syzygium grande]
MCLRRKAIVLWQICNKLANGTADLCTTGEKKKVDGSRFNVKGPTQDYSRTRYYIVPDSPTNAGRRQSPRTAKVAQPRGLVSHGPPEITRDLGSLGLASPLIVAEASRPSASPRLAFGHPSSCI